MGCPCAVLSSESGSYIETKRKQKINLSVESKQNPKQKKKALIQTPTRNIPCLSLINSKNYSLQKEI